MAARRIKLERYLITKLMYLAKRIGSHGSPQIDMRKIEKIVGFLKSRGGGAAATSLLLIKESNGIMGQVNIRPD